MSDAFFLHAYCPKGGYDNNEDVVFCLELTSWKVVPLKKPTKINSGHLYTKNGPDPNQDMMLRLSNGCRFYIVKNDPMRVQRPNGRIVWRWEG